MKRGSEGEEENGVERGREEGGGWEIRDENKARRRSEVWKKRKDIPAPNGTYENFSLLDASAWRNLDKQNSTRHQYKRLSW